jgi:hypothetical protein
MKYKKCIHCNKKKLHTEEFFYRVIEKKRRNYNKEYTYLMGTCKECWNINAKESRKKYQASIIKRRIKYNNSERGYFIGMFNNIKQNHKRKKQKNEFKNYEEFYQCWLDQQKIYGRLCPYTGKKMTMIRHTGSKKKFLLIYLEKEFYLQEDILKKILCLCLGESITQKET